MVRESLLENNLEFNPLYSKIEYELTRIEDDGDPLNLEQGYLVDWVSLSRDIDQLLSQQVDIRVLVWRLRAGLHMDGFSSLNKYLKEINEIILEFKSQETLSEKEKDILSAYSSSLSFFSSPSFISEIKNAKIYPEEMALIRTFLDIDKPDFTDISSEELAAITKKADAYFVENEIPLLNIQLKENLDLVTEISDYVNEFSSGYILETQILRDTLTKLSGKIAPLYEVFSEDEIPDVVNVGLEAQNNNVTTGFGFNQAINNRKDVVTALDNLLKYFNSYEPSHPAPILIRRIRKMIGMDFETIIKDLLPDSEESLKVYLGTRNSGSSDESEQFLNSN